METAGNNLQPIEFFAGQYLVTEFDVGGAVTKMAQLAEATN
jgi:hypothetical protein